MDTKIELKVSEFVKALHTLSPAQLKCLSTGGTSKEFPFGCCKNTSVLLAHALKNVYDIETELVTVKGCLHFCLRYQGYIIDLTARQFDASLPAILIVPVDERPEVLKRFGSLYPIDLGEIGEDKLLKPLQIEIENRLSFQL